MFYFARNVDNLAKSSYNIRQLCKTHYEILNLSQNCSAKEIKTAYIELSKQYHPDISNDANSQKKFLEISEAYSILSKEETRHNYDLGLNSGFSCSRPNDIRTTKNPWDDISFWNNRSKQYANYRNKPYYGIKGVKRVPNAMIVLLCVCVAFLGVTLQVVAINKSFTLNRDEMIRRSEAAYYDLSKIRADAEEKGNKAQIEIMRQKMKDNGTFRDDPFD